MQSLLYLHVSVPQIILKSTSETSFVPGCPADGSRVLSSDPCTKYWLHRDAINVLTFILFLSFFWETVSCSSNLICSRDWTFYSSFFDSLRKCMYIMYCFPSPSTLFRSPSVLQLPLFPTSPFSHSFHFVVLWSTDFIWDYLCSI